MACFSLRLIFFFTGVARRSALSLLCMSSRFHCFPHRLRHLPSRFFGIGFVSPPQIQNEKMAIPTPLPKAINHVLVSLTQADEEIIKLALSRSFPSYSLELKLRDCRRVAAICKEVVQRVTGRSLQPLPLRWCLVHGIIHFQE